MPHKDQTSELMADIREQILYMKELGVGLLNVDVPASKADEEQSELVVSTVVEDASVLSARADVPKGIEKKRSRLSALPSLPRRTP